jgi:hypothetical protein
MTLLTRIVGQRPGAPNRFLDQESVLTWEKLLELALRICVANYQNGNGSVIILASSLILFLCETVPRCLRVSYMGNCSSGATCLIDPLRLISWFHELLSTGCEYHIVPGEISIVTSLIRACLRFGIGTTDVNNTKMRSACLELIALFVITLHDGTATFRPLASSLSLTLASQLFTMATSHSKFASLMNSKDEDAVKIEALRILHGCLSATHDIEFDGDVWCCLLASFNAGMTEIDHILRRLLILYTRKAPKVRRSSYLTHLHSI